MRIWDENYVFSGRYTKSFPYQSSHASILFDLNNNMITYDNQVRPQSIVILATAISSVLAENLLSLMAKRTLMQSFSWGVNTIISCFGASGVSQNNNKTVWFQSAVQPAAHVTTLNEPWSDIYLLAGTCTIRPALKVGNLKSLWVYPEAMCASGWREPYNLLTSLSTRPKSWEAFFTTESVFIGVPLGSAEQEPIIVFVG